MAKKKKKATRKVAKKKVKKKKTVKKVDGRKPAWKLVTPTAIEAARKQFKIGKVHMAQRLGVTNSTYHNWVRGTSVANAATQEKIKAILAEGVGKAPEKAPEKAVKIKAPEVSRKRVVGLALLDLLVLEDDQHGDLIRAARRLLV